MENTMLLPGATKAEKTRAQHDLLAHALACIERCQGYVPLLEREREILLAALALAWRREQYQHVISLVSGLAYLAGRLDDHGQGQRILLQGIHACRETRDEYYLALFLNRLSGLLHAQGAYTRARQLWDESLSSAHLLGRSACLWEPLASFAYMIDIPSAYETVQHFAQTLLSSPQSDEPATATIALFTRGFCQHLAGNDEKAIDDFSACLRLLASYTTPSLYKHFFEIEVQAELARAQGDFPNARAYTQAALSLSETLCDPYITAVLLWDEAMFANRQGILSDVYPLVSHLVALSRYIKAPHVFKWCSCLIQQLPHDQQSEFALTLARNFNVAERSLPSPHHLQSSPHAELLSQRELEVLRFVANGYSNQEIAAQLVITVGTVKKHLEHISNKLDAQSRTHAVARARESGML
ncbi:MAG TPA: response regulator transcription factor, partial [Ktedonobacteraceae bacterium]|nr:response regulator transcription factor [Ktedonobacteraceae bacterium]